MTRSPKTGWNLTLPGSLRRRDVLARTLGIASAAPLAAATKRLSAVAQDSGGSEVAVAPSGRNNFEFVATVHQQGFEFVFYGYLTRVDGIEPSLLFTNTDPTNRGPGDARLTIYGEVVASSRSIIEQVFNVNGDGVFGIHYSESGGATFDDPASFQTDTLVASGPANIQSVITVIAPQTGLANGYGDLMLETAEAFSIGDVSFRFRTGEPLSRLGYTGQGTLLDPDLPESMISVVGYASSVG
jgi:hypothetical protein